MNAKRFAWTAALCAALVFLAVNLAAPVLLRVVRWDVSQGQHFSLSEASREVLRTLDEPITVTLFFTRAAEAEDATMRAAVSRLRGLLDAYARQGGTRVRVFERDPDSDLRALADAEAAGVSPFRLQPDGPTLYFGLQVVNSVDESRTIVRLDTEGAQTPEFAITSKIAELSQSGRTRIALISSLPMWRDDQALPSNALAIMKELAARAQIDVLARDFRTIPANVDALVLLHPWPLNAEQLYAVDQFFMQIGRGVIVVDPAYLGARASPFDPLGDAIASGSEVNPLLARWGLVASADVILDRDGALPVQVRTLEGLALPTPQPLYFRAAIAEEQDAATRGLSFGVNVGAAGDIQVTPSQTLQVTPLLQTSMLTARFPGDIALSQPPPELTQQAPFAARRGVIAVRVTGSATSMFGEARPQEVTASDAPTHLSVSQRDLNVVLINDVDYLEARYYLGGPSGSSAVADNAAFTLNAVESVVGSQTLSALRARQETPRRLTVLDDWSAQSKAESAATLQTQQARLDEAQARMARLSTSDDRAAHAQSVADVAAARAALRDMERQTQARIDGAQRWITLANVWLAPFLVLAIGGFWAWRRGRAR